MRTIFIRSKDVSQYQKIIKLLNLIEFEECFIYDKTSDSIKVLSVRIKVRIKMRMREEMRVEMKGKE